MAEGGGGLSFGTTRDREKGSLYVRSTGDERQQYTQQLRRLLCVLYVSHSCHAHFSACCTLSLARSLTPGRSQVSQAILASV
jgi:hypothetical protein